MDGKGVFMSNDAAIAEVSPEVSSDTPADEQIEASETTETETPSGEQEVLQKSLESKIKSLKLKIDGVEVEENLPFEVSPEQAEWLRKELQLARVANKRMQEAADLRKSKLKTDEDVNSFLNALETDPMAVLEKLGINTKEISEKRLQAEIEKMQMSEEDRKIAELQEKIRLYEEEQTQLKEQARLEKEEAMKTQYAAEYEKDLLGAMDVMGLGNNPELVQRMNHYMASAIKLGIDISFNDLIPLIQESLNNDLMRLVPSLSIEQIEKLLGEDKIKGIVGKRKVVKKEAPPTASSIQDTATRKEENPFAPKYKTVNAKDFFKKI